METISNVVSTASKAIWGEQNNTTNETGGKEPASGLQGKGTATEPYDGGNAPTPLEPAGKTDPFATTSTTDPLTDTTMNTTPTNKAPTEVASGTSVDKTSTTAITDSEPKPLETTTGVTSDTIASETSKLAINPTSAVINSEPKPLETTEGTGVTGSSAQKFAPKDSDIIPSESSNNTGVPPASGAAPSLEQQGADRPTEAPKEDDQEALLKKHDSKDNSGEPMHMHNGPEKEVPAIQEEHRESNIGLPGGQEHGKEAKGTGEKWEKTTGLAADGGDFDATKPGAGKEADRTLTKAASTVESVLSRADMITGLLEEKGVHRNAKGSMDKKPEITAGAADGGKEKVSKMEKLKEKLHIGHGHKDK